MYANLFEKNVQNNGINRHDARMSSEAKEQNKYKSKSKTTGAASQPTMATGTSTPDTNRVCIKMIARSTTREQLKDSLQASFGTVTDVQMFRPKLGIAWAEFALRESCEKALASRAVMVASSLVKIVKWRG
ncbi:hypothetical protein EJ04DRAFT_517711 [Polyplosphaeria fusca]|uniref:RRM domain-containing protein n=1 Tax=Polyplosphaeria fusca TaxID=682080 RepID=A0A9P4QG52_9PLEO|nr:hypothetical protein EJ04DRAFT_517711 [Polyplosphaeria fusca]